jgi:hypothetical protein
MKGEEITITGVGNNFYCIFITPLYNFLKEMPHETL